MRGTDSFREHLGIECIEVKEGYAKMVMKVTKQHTNSLGFTHGGAIFSLADCAFAEAANFGDATAVAVQVNINFFRPTKEGDLLTAEANLVSEGKTFGLYNITVCKEEKIVAFFSGLSCRH
ncbi:MAG: hotdog fold thioesterase [Candidatus Bathyarchaeota archaeon]|nr:hotdog fold thioesterase [Candidatus Bathyarchaeota archaeon]